MKMVTRPKSYLIILGIACICSVLLVLSKIRKFDESGDESTKFVTVLGKDSTDLLKVEDQYTAMSGLFRIARSCYVKVPTDANEANLLASISGQVDQAGKHSNMERDRLAALYMLAKTCNLYCADNSGKADPRQLAYFDVLEDAFWDCCRRISTVPGPAAHQCLVDLKKELTNPPYFQIDDLIAVQRSLK